MESWIEAGLAAASFLFGLLSWWASHKSKAARKAAETAEENAKRATEAAEASAEELRKLVESLSRPPLVASRPSATSRSVMVLNTTAETIVISEVRNADEFVKLIADTELPFTIPPGAQFEILVMGAMGAPTPSNFHFAISQGDQEHDVHVPIPSRSSERKTLH